MLAETLQPIGAALDPDRVRRAAHEIERAARDIEPPDMTELVRTLSLVPDRLDEAIRDGGDAVRGAVQHLPIRRQQRSRRPTPAKVAAVAIGLGAIAVAGWLALRWRASARARSEEARLDAEALERAGNEGMGAAAGVTEVHAVAEPAVPTPLAAVPIEPQDRPSDDLFVRPTVGSGFGADR